MTASDRIKDFYLPQLEEMKHIGVQHPEKDFDTFCSSIAIQDAYNLYKSYNLSEIDPALIQKIDDFIKRRRAREPMERILNQASFRGLDFEIAPHIFKPGFETESTIDHALEKIKDIPNPVILDCGTGSGCLLISLLMARPDAHGIGIDIDDDILNIAKRNAARHNVSDRTEFLISDWGNDLHRPIDLIISNPPRIPTHLVQSLVKEVAIYDPFIALDGGKKGEVFYRKSAELLHRIGNPHATCVIQVGQVVLDQAAKSIKQVGYYDIEVGRSYKFTPNCLIFSNQKFKATSPWYYRMSKLFVK